MRFQRFASTLILAGLAIGSVAAAELVLAETKSNLVPNPVPYAVLLPDGYKDAAKPLPLLILLHGGGGSRDMLTTFKPMFEELWQSGKLSKMIVTCFSTALRGFYVDRKDGTQKWESFVMGPYIELMEKTYHASANPKEHFLTGISMGGMGTLRMGFKYPERFGAIASLEAGIEPILHYADMRTKDRFYRPDELFENAFGKPVDPVYWEANNPASIAKADPKRLIQSGLKIYIDAAGHDMYFLYEGNEFLHRLLYDAGVEHEYHIVHGADHVGQTLRPRMTEAVLFLNRALNPPGPDPAVINARKNLIPQKTRAGIVDPLDPRP